MSDTRSYAVLASAIAGRRIAVHLAESRHDTLTFSDGQVVWLPASRAGRSDARWDIVAQASLIAMGSLSRTMLRQLLSRRPLTLERYLVMEVLRASRELAARLPLRYSQLPEIAAAASCPPSTSAAASLEIALGKQALPARPDYFGVIRPYAALRRRGDEPAPAAESQRQAPLKLAFAPPPELPDDEAAEESRILKLFANPWSSGSGFLSRLLGAGVQKSDAGSAAGDVELPVGRIVRVLKRGARAFAATLDLDPPSAEADLPSAECQYPEWDAGHNRYRRDWVSAEVVEPWREDGPRETSFLANFPSMELRRQLAPLGLSFRMHGRQIDGADLDMGPLIKAAIDLRTGHTPSVLRVYRASRCTRRDLAVAIALDVSGSTGEQVEAQGSQFEKQMQAAYQLGQAFDALGDTVQIFGFHSWGRRQVHWLPLKNHDERWSGAVTARFAQLEPLGFTRMGAAIRHADRELRTVMRLPHRLIVLVTDGFPYDQGYESSYAEADVGKALEEARSHGTACVCLCVGTSVEGETLRRMFGAAHLLMVDEPGQIAREIRGACRNAFATAFRQRRQRAPSVSARGASASL